MFADQIPVREALALLKPLLEDRSVLKIVQDMKYDIVVMSRHGIEVGPFDDTMLVSWRAQYPRLLYPGQLTVAEPEVELYPGMERPLAWYRPARRANTFMKLP